MTGLVSRTNARRYGWGDGCEGWHLVADPELSVIEERMPPKTSEVRHRHERARQFFYVLDGTLEIEIEGTSHRLVRGCGVEIPPGAAHQVTNPGPEAAAFLVVSAPPAQQDRIPA